MVICFINNSNMYFNHDQLILKRENVCIYKLGLIQMKNLKKNHRFDGTCHNYKLFTDKACETINSNKLYGE